MYLGLEWHVWCGRAISQQIEVTGKNIRTTTLYKQKPKLSPELSQGIV
jgi:hypothetical protein